MKLDRCFIECPSERLVSFSPMPWVFFAAMENGSVMASDILQRTLRELHALGASSPALESAVSEFEQAKDDRSRRAAGDQLLAMLTQCIAQAQAQPDGEKRATMIALYEALGAHVPADPL